MFIRLFRTISEPEAKERLRIREGIDPAVITQIQAKRREAKNALEEYSPPKTKELVQHFLKTFGRAHEDSTLALLHELTGEEDVDDGIETETRMFDFSDSGIDHLVREHPGLSLEALIVDWRLPEARNKPSEGGKAHRHIIPAQSVLLTIGAEHWVGGNHPCCPICGSAKVRPNCRGLWRCENTTGAHACAWHNAQRPGSSIGYRHIEDLTPVSFDTAYEAITRATQRAQEALRETNEQPIFGLERFVSVRG